MNKRNIFSKLSIGIAFVAIASTVTIWEARRVRAFNPQPDPPGFGMISLNLGQAARLNVVCSQHGVNGLPPDPCRGVLMFHSTEGNDLQRVPYALRPGQSMSLEQRMPLDTGQFSFSIQPCIIPAPYNQGRAIPSVEVFDTTSGKTEFYINAIPRLSDFDAAHEGPSTAATDTAGE